MPPPGPPPIPLMLNRLRGNPGKRNRPTPPEPAVLPKAPESGSEPPTVRAPNLKERATCEESTTIAKRKNQWATFREF
jgi:hypothetical protein